MADILIVIKNLHSVHSHFLNSGSLPLTTAPTDNNRNFRLTLQLHCLLWQREMKEMESNLSQWRSSYSSQLLTLIDQRLPFICFTCILSTAHLSTFCSLFSHLTSVLSRWIHFLWNSISSCLSDAVGLSVSHARPVFARVTSKWPFTVSVSSVQHAYETVWSAIKCSTTYNFKANIDCTMWWL